MQGLSLLQFTHKGFGPYCLYAYPPCCPDINEQVVFCTDDCLANSVAVCNQSLFLDFMIHGTENFVLQFDWLNASSYLLPVSNQNFL